MHTYKRYKTIHGKERNGVQEDHTGGLKTNIQNSIFSFFYIKSKRYEETIAKCYNLAQLGRKSKKFVIVFSIPFYIINIFAN